MKSILLRLFFILLLATNVFVIGCNNDGPMEEAGENIEEAADEVGDAVEDAGDKMK